MNEVVETVTNPTWPLWVAGFVISAVVVYFAVRKKKINKGGGTRPGGPKQPRK